MHGLKNAPGWGDFKEFPVCDIHCKRINKENSYSQYYLPAPYNNFQETLQTLTYAGVVHDEQCLIHTHKNLKLKQDLKLTFKLMETLKEKTVYQSSKSAPKWLTLKCQN